MSSAKSNVNSSDGNIWSFKRRKAFKQREQESERMRELHPIKIPVIIERYKKEKMLPHLDRSKFLIPAHVEVAELMQILRRRMELHQSQTLFLLVNEKNIPGNTETMRDIYEREMDDDGFLYILFASELAFGS